jgi:hypothetical protein
MQNEIAMRLRGFTRAVPACIALVAAEPARAQSPQRTTDPKAFTVEALAGSVGSLVGIGIIGLASTCDVEDLRCILLTVGAGGALGAVGATIGTSLAARAMHSPRSVGGAALGAVVGTGVGLGVHWLLNNSSDRNLGDRIVVPIFVLSQGVFATLGSRALGRAR